MRSADILANGVAALRADRRQTALAGAGIVCGVAAVVTALAIGDGARREALAEVAALGIDNVVLDSASMRLTASDASAIAAVPGAAAVAPARTGQLQLETPAARLTAPAWGVTGAWPSTVRVAITRGRWLSASDLASHRRVAVLGAALARRLYPAGRVVGAPLRLASEWFVVVGVHDAPLPADAVFVPLAALDARLSPQDGADRLNRIVVATRAPDDPVAVAARIERLIRRREPADAVQVFVPREVAAARMRARRALDALLLAIGTLVLGTGGLGIMNVMLAGVARRVGEIGIRRAVGARRRDIVAHFAAEAALLCAAGGLIGLPLGAAAAAAVGRGAGWTIAVSAGSLGLALAMALGAGMAFGVYPALVAARWTSCEALRHE